MVHLLCKIIEIKFEIEIKMKLSLNCHFPVYDRANYRYRYTDFGHIN